jgi:hypothetical protein
MDDLGETQRERERERERESNLGTHLLHIKTPEGKFFW